MRRVCLGSKASPPPTLACGLLGRFTRRPEAFNLCQEAGLAKMGRVALDGRKVAANAALDQNRDGEAIEREVRRMLAEAERVDAEEDEQYGPDQRGDELPEELRTKEGRLKRLKEARARLEEQQRRARQEQEHKIEAREAEEQASGRKKPGRKPKPPEEAVDTEAKTNLTDPDSRIMKTRRGWLQGYNGQAMADCETQVIVAQGLTQAENDVEQLAPMLAACQAQAGERPGEVLGDAGYWSEANARLADERTELFIATRKDWKQRKALREQPAPRGRIPRNATLRERMERKLLTRRGRAASTGAGARTSWTSARRTSDSARPSAASRRTSSSSSSDWTVVTLAANTASASSNSSNTA